MSTVASVRLGRPVAASRPRRRIRWRRVALYGSSSLMALHLAVPAAWAVYTSLRPFARHAASTATSRCRQTLNLDNFIDAWDRGELPQPLPQHAARSSSRP